MFVVSGYGRSGLIGVVLAVTAGATVATLHAQTQLADPKDAPKIFATTCSACHKSPAGLAKSGQVAGFLRQHYTTGPEMSAAMAAYLVSAGSGPAGKKGQTEARKEPGEPQGQKGKQKREASAQAGEPKTPRESAKENAKEAAKEAREAGKEFAKEKRLLRKQLQAKGHEEQAAPPHPSPASAAESMSRPAAVPAPATTAVAEAPAPVPAAAPAAVETPAAPSAAPPVTLNIPMPEMPTSPPADLTQSVFSSSPVP